MVKSGLALTALGLLAMFGYFFVTAPANQSGTDRAKDAAVRLGDTVKDQGAASVVSARLKAGLGLDGSRFLHVYYDDGAVLIYGLAPADVTAERLTSLAREVPSVTSVEVQILPRPEYLNAKPAPEATPETPAETEGDGA